MRLLTDDEIIHVPIRYLNKYGEEVPSLTPTIDSHNCLRILKELLNTRLTFKKTHNREPTENELTKLLYERS